MIEVRAFEPDDLPALWALAHLPDAGVTEDATVPLPLPPRRVPPSGPPELVDPQASVLAHGGDLLVAEQGGHMLGAGGLRPVRGRPHLGRLVRIRVHPAARRRGVARQVMARLEDCARRRGLTDLLLDVGDHQPEALAFYRALGWSETWRQAGPEWHWQTVWFHRSLSRDHLPVEVRPCTGALDVAAAELALPTGPNGFHEARWRRQLAEEATYLLAWDGDSVVGHVLVLRHSRHEDVVAVLGDHHEVSALGVAERARRRGVATALMGAAAGIAQEHGSQVLGLAVAPDNHEALPLFRRLGWVARPGLAAVDAWSWVDGGGVEHQERDRCRYWTLDLLRGRTRGADRAG
ncbi:MAG: GNAT family N-acetyltransferase [Nocardioides sp.]